MGRNLSDNFCSAPYLAQGLIDDSCPEAYGQTAEKGLS